MIATRSIKHIGWETVGRSSDETREGRCHQAAPIDSTATLWSEHADRRNSEELFFNLAAHLTEMPSAGVARVYLA